MYKTIRLKEETYSDLIDVINELQKKENRKVTFDYAISYLVKYYKNKKIEVKV